MNNTPFFTVIIPVFNKEPYVARAIKSVLRQTFSNFEIVIVCDPSTDNSNAEVAKFIDQRIRVFHRNELGAGGYAARNLGITNVKAEWIAFLDADDEWYPYHLEKIKILSESYPETYIMGCGWEVVKQHTIKTDNYYIDNYGKSHKITLEQYLKNCLDNKRPIHTSIACVRKSSPKAIGLFPADSRSKRGGDLHAWLKMICHHKEMSWSNHIGARYFLDIEDQVSNTAESSPFLLDSSTFQSLAIGLDHDEKIKLKKLFNLGLRTAWLGNFERGNRNFNLYSYLYFRDDFLNALFCLGLSLTPKKILDPLLKIWWFFKN